MIFDHYQFTSQGGRSYNEDSVGSKDMNGHGIFVVADGLGGHSFGELASACVRDCLIGGWSPETEGITRETWFETKVSEANQSVLAHQKEKGCALKSTVVALMVDGTSAVWGNSGDSRLYYLHQGKIHSITEDHSVAYKKYKAGEITREQIGSDEDQSCLLRAIGNEDRFEADIHTCDVPVEPGDAFMLCSDGVWEYLKDEEILIDLLKSDNAKEWAELLLMRVMSRISPGNDNLSILTVMMKE